MSARTRTGRPRKQSDTRRAQVREAQRAYRSRQQSQLSSLKARVEQLENAFASMSQTIHAFDDQVIQSASQWSQPRLFHAVQLLRNEIVSQFKKAAISFQDTAPSSGLELSQIKDANLGQYVSETPANPQPPSQTNFWDCFLNSSSAMIPSANTLLQDDPSDALLPRSFSPPVTDAPTIQYATTPFTQRLFRAVAESGYRFLSNLEYKDEDIWPEFGLSLQTMPRAHIRAYFERVVSLHICNPILDTRFPFISLGGAGTHFPSPVHDALPSRLELFRGTNGMIHVHSDEDWFDVHDIEGYLISEGIGLGEYPSLLSSISSIEETGTLALNGSVPGTMKVIDEYKLINSMFSSGLAFLLIILINSTSTKPTPSRAGLRGWLSPI
ncbi:uncharacterized protein N7446_006192 [Penicillium canescens]|uniref:uncharacterized protein n=1 Tax=Penicillium canescens TaxID=5083 RepID=UPI0026DEE92C|nr:uncharacterized protein N7446_006192 [Penicillium canescens]KAJ6062072.1 hypothetical protein N7446_006192 [Penicillium canescens]